MRRKDVLSLFLLFLWLIKIPLNSSSLWFASFTRIKEILQNIFRHSLLVNRLIYLNKVSAICHYLLDIKVHLVSVRLKCNQDSTCRWETNKGYEGWFMVIDNILIEDIRKSVGPKSNLFRNLLIWFQSFPIFSLLYFMALNHNEWFFLAEEKIKSLTTEPQKSLSHFLSIRNDYSQLQINKGFLIVAQRQCTKFKNMYDMLAKYGKIFNLYDST